MYLKLLPRFKCLNLISTFIITVWNGQLSSSLSPFHPENHSSYYFFFFLVGNEDVPPDAQPSVCFGSLGSERLKTGSIHRPVPNTQSGQTGQSADAALSYQLKDNHEPEETDTQCQVTAYRREKSIHLYLGPQCFLCNTSAI